MLEAAVIIDFWDRPIYWHDPPNRSAIYLPDSPQLWSKLWEHRDNLGGVAHSHPGSGWPCPSDTDLTTFSAINRAFDRSLPWWITSRDRLVLCTIDRAVDGISNSYSILTYEHVEDEAIAIRWLPELRRRSYQEDLAERTNNDPYP